jgi:hypothetical protein
MADDGRRSEPIFEEIGTNLLVTLTANQTSYAPGERFELGRTLNVVRATARAQGGLYVRVQDPAGRVAYLGGDPAQFRESVFPGKGTVRSPDTPAFRSDPWPLDIVPDLQGTFFVRRTVLATTVPDGLPAGTYTFDATFVRPGGDPRDPSAVITTSIPISVNVATPSRVGHSAIRVTSGIVGIAPNPRTNMAAVARDPGILSLVNLATERVVFSTPLLDPGEAALGQGLTWGGSLGAVAVNPVTNIAVVTNAQPVFAGVSSFTPFVALLDLSTGRVTAHLALDPSPAIADPRRRGCLSWLVLNDRVLAVRPVVINSRTNTAVVASITQAQPERTTLYFVDLARAAITQRFFVEPRINSIAIDEARNRLIGIRSPDLPGFAEFFVLDLADLTFRFVPFPGGLERFCGASRTLAILPDTGEVLVTGDRRQPDNTFVGAVTAIDVDRGRAAAPAEVAGTTSAQDPVLLPGSRRVLVNGLAPGLSRLALVNVDQRRLEGLFETSISAPIATLAPAADTFLLGGDLENLYVLRSGAAASERPVGGLRVQVRNAASGAALHEASVVVDGVGFAALTNRGSVIFPAVPPGPQAVVVSAAGFDSQAARAVIEVGRTEEVSVALQPGGAVAPLRGRVLVEGGAGVGPLRLAPATVAPSRQALVGQPGVTIRIPGTILQVVSGSGGSFRIEQAPVGTFLVDATAQGFQDAREIVAIRRDADNQLLLTLLRTLGG